MTEEKFVDLNEIVNILSSKKDNNTADTEILENIISVFNEIKSTGAIEIGPSNKVLSIIDEIFNNDFPSVNKENNALYKFLVSLINSVQNNPPIEETETVENTPVIEEEKESLDTAEVDSVLNEILENTGAIEENIDDKFPRTGFSFNVINSFIESLSDNSLQSLFSNNSGLTDVNEIRKYLKEELADKFNEISVTDLSKNTNSSNKKEKIKKSFEEQISDSIDKYSNRLAKNIGDKLGRGVNQIINIKETFTDVVDMVAHPVETFRRVQSNGMTALFKSDEAKELQKVGISKRTLNEKTVLRNSAVGIAILWFFSNVLEKRITKQNQEFEETKQQIATSNLSNVMAYGAGNFLSGALSSNFMKIAGIVLATVVVSGLLFMFLKKFFWDKNTEQTNTVSSSKPVDLNNMEQPNQPPSVAKPVDLKTMATPSQQPNIANPYKLELPKQTETPMSYNPNNIKQLLDKENNSEQSNIIQQNRTQLNFTTKDNETENLKKMLDEKNKQRGYSEDIKKINDNTGFWDSVKNFFGKIVDNVKDLGNKLKDVGKKIWGSIGDVLNATKDKVYSMTNRASEVAEDCSSFVSLVSMAQLDETKNKKEMDFFKARPTAQNQMSYFEKNNAVTQNLSGNQLTRENIIELVDNLSVGETIGMKSGNRFGHVMAVTGRDSNGRPIVTDFNSYHGGQHTWNYDELVKYFTKKSSSGQLNQLEVGSVSKLIQENKTKDVGLQTANANAVKKEQEKVTEMISGVGDTIISTMSAEQKKTNEATQRFFKTENTTTNYFENTTVISENSLNTYDKGFKIFLNKTCGVNVSRAIA